LRVGPGFVIAVCFVLNMLGRGIGDSYAVFLLPLEREFGWTRSQLTSVYSVYLLVSGFMAPMIGLLFDRAGPRWVYGVGIASIGSGFLLAGSLDELWQFYVLVGAMVGAGTSMTGMVPASALLSRWFRGRLARAIGITFSGSGLGLVTFVPIAQALQDNYGWRYAYQVLGTGFLVLLPVVALVLPWKRIAAGTEPDSRTHGRVTQGDWTVRSAIRTRIYWGMVQAFFFTALGMFSVFIQLVAFLVASGFSTFTAAFAFGVCGMLSAGSVMGSGFLVERFGTLRTVTTAFAGSATGVTLLLLMSRHPSLPLLTAFVLIFGMSLGVRGPIISSMCTRHFAGPRVATIYGTVFATNSIGAALGSLIGGVIHDLTGGYTVVFIFSLCSLALASAPFWTVPALRHFR